MIIMINAIVDFLNSNKKKRSRLMKEKRNEDLRNNKTIVKPLKSRYSYGSEVDKRMISRARLRTGRKRS